MKSLRMVWQEDDNSIKVSNSDILVLDENTVSSQCHYKKAIMDKSVCFLLQQFAVCVLNGEHANELGSDGVPKNTLKLVNTWKDDEGIIQASGQLIRVLQNALSFNKSEPGDLLVFLLYVKKGIDIGNGKSSNTMAAFLSVQAAGLDVKEVGLNYKQMDLHAIYNESFELYNESISMKKNIECLYLWLDHYHQKKRGQCSTLNPANVSWPELTNASRVYSACNPDALQKDGLGYRESKKFRLDAYFDQKYKELDDSRSEVSTSTRGSWKF